MSTVEDEIIHFFTTIVHRSWENRGERLYASFVEIVWEY